MGIKLVLINITMVYPKKKKEMIRLQQFYNIFTTNPK